MGRSQVHLPNHPLTSLMGVDLQPSLLGRRDVLDETVGPARGGEGVQRVIQSDIRPKISHSPAIWVSVCARTD